MEKWWSVEDDLADVHAKNEMAVENFNNFVVPIIEPVKDELQKLASSIHLMTKKLNNKLG